MIGLNLKSKEKKKKQKNRIEQPIARFIKNEDFSNYLINKLRNFQVHQVCEYM